MARRAGFFLAQRAQTQLPRGAWEPEEHNLSADYADYAD